MYKYIKRIFDILLSLFGLIIFFPFLAVIAVCVKCESKGNVLFTQKRVGIGKTHFMIYKFRTMYTDAPRDVAANQLMNPEKFVTKTGRFLRKTRMDELPQLVNILRGDMSFVGPRPALWNQFDLIAEREKVGADKIRPGLTGLAQIYWSESQPVELKAKLDGEYAQKMGLGYDVWLIFLTVRKVFNDKWTGKSRA